MKYVLIRINTHYQLHYVQNAIFAKIAFTNISVFSINVDNQNTTVFIELHFLSTT